MDIDEQRLDILFRFSQRMVENSSIKIFSTLILEEAIENADFIINQIRVGGQKARNLDIRICLESNLIGQETVGAGGFSNALRTIPQSLKIAQTMERFAPEALLINFANPSGMITEAIRLSSKIKVIGVCNIPLLMKMDISKHFNWNLSELDMDYIGLNHLSWLRRVFLNKREVTSIVLKEYPYLGNGRYRFPRSLIKELRVLPSPYLRYFYFPQKVLRELKLAPQTRAEQVMQIEQRLLDIYKSLEIREKPSLLNSRGGIYYGETAVNLILALLDLEKQTIILNIPNSDTVPWMNSDSIIEVPCEVSSSGIFLVNIGQVEPWQKAIISTIKSYEELTIRASLEGDRNLAFKALLIHPLVGAATKAKVILKKILDTHKQYLPQFD